MTTVIGYTWSGLILPREQNWPCARSSCKELSAVAGTDPATGWRYGFCLDHADEAGYVESRLQAMLRTSGGVIEWPATAWGGDINLYVRAEKVAIARCDSADEGENWRLTFFAADGTPTQSSVSGGRLSAPASSLRDYLTRIHDVPPAQIDEYQNATHTM